MSHEWKCSQVREMAKCLLPASLLFHSEAAFYLDPPSASGLDCLSGTDTDISIEHAPPSPALQKPGKRS